MASKVHRVRYYNPKPQPINALAVNSRKKHIALARGDASIEIWDLNSAPFLIKFIPGVEGGSVEALGWVNQRLLSTGISGALLEWDLDTCSVKKTILLTGSAAWCLDVNSSNTLVAAGTEQGYVNLYSVEDDDIVYKRLFDKQEGRIMCCKFDSTGTILVTGSINTIRVWNVETGHATCRISASRRGVETLVWCLAVLSDNVVVSGDSLGRLTFWDSSNGDQIESFQSHRADILSIAVSENEKSIYYSGVDPIVAHFVKVDKVSGADGKVSAQWVKHVQRHIHEHDVRCLAMCGEKLVSLGADGYLTLSSYPPKWVMRVPPMIPNPTSSVCAAKKLLLLRYSNHLEVWKLGSHATNGPGKPVLTNKVNKPSKSQTAVEEDSTMEVVNEATTQFSSNQLALAEGPVKLVTIRTKGDKQIRFSTMSPDGQYILYSTDTDTRMLKLETDEDPSSTSLTKVELGELAAVSRAVVSADGRCAVLRAARAMLVLALDAGAGLTHTIDTSKYLKSHTCLHLTLSDTPSGTYLVAGDTEGTIAVWKQNKSKFEHHATLPRYEYLPSAITVDHKRNTLIVVYVDQKITEYDLQNKKYLDSLPNQLPPEWYSREWAVQSVATHPARDALVFQDHTSLWVLERSQNESEKPTAAKRKPAAGKNMNFKIIPMKYLAGFHWVGSEEAVAVEVLPENIVAQLPPALAVKRRG